MSIKMKRILILIGIIILVIMLFGPSLMWQKYENQEHGFSISLPRLWVKAEGAYGTIILAKAPKEDENDIFQENINVTISSVPPGVHPDTFFEMFKNETFDLIPGEEFDISEGEISAGSLRGRWLSFSSEGKDITGKSLTAVWIKDDVAYIVACTAQDTQFAKYESTFKKSIRSFRIK